MSNKRSNNFLKNLSINMLNYMFYLFEVKLFFTVFYFKSIIFSVSAKFDSLRVADATIEYAFPVSILKDVNAKIASNLPDNLL